MPGFFYGLRRLINRDEMTPHGIGRRVGQRMRSAPVATDLDWRVKHQHEDHDQESDHDHGRDLADKARVDT
jgi:hypothetical protein